MTEYYLDRQEWLNRFGHLVAKHPAYGYVEADPALPNILLIGDSISIGYTLTVRNSLHGIANIYRVPCNAGDTATGLRMHRDWLGNMKWDIIHFNWGLHDLKYWRDGNLDLSGDLVRSPDEYAVNLDELIIPLQQTGAILIWATTTPVPEGAQGRIQGSELIYNNRAEFLMSRHNIPINDLHRLVMDHACVGQIEADVHFHPNGYELLGNQTAYTIKGFLY